MWSELVNANPDVDEAMIALGECSPTSNANEKLVKGYVEDGKVYYSAKDLRAFASGCLKAAEWLEQRAADTNTEGTSP